MLIDSESLDSGILKINIAGRMDTQAAEEIDMKLAGYVSTHCLVIVDMSAVSFVASMGIRSLLLSAMAVTRRGGKMVLFNPDANVTHILEIAGIDTVIPICRSLDKARAALSA